MKSFCRFLIGALPPRAISWEEIPFAEHQVLLSLSLIGPFPSLFFFVAGRARTFFRVSERLPLFGFGSRGRVWNSQAFLTLGLPRKISSRTKPRLLFHLSQEITPLVEIVLIFRIFPPPDVETFPTISRQTSRAPGKLSVVVPSERSAFGVASPFLKLWLLEVVSF